VIFVGVAEPKTPSFDKLRMRFSTEAAPTIVLILSSSKDEDDARKKTALGPTCRGAATIRPAPNMANSR
jgi:hypothetical protein